MTSSSKFASKRIVSLLLAAVMTIGMCVPVGATEEYFFHALENVDIVEAGAQTEESLVEVPLAEEPPVEASLVVLSLVKVTGAGTKASPYLIRNDTELAALAAASRADGTSSFGSGKYYLQTADLTLNDVGFAYFNGVYDGGGHTVELNITQTVEIAGSTCAGMFGQLGSEGGTAAEVKNLKLAGSMGAQAAPLSTTHCGALAAWNSYADVSDVSSTAAIYTSGIYTGGLVGFNFGKITNSWNSGTLTGGSTYTGGLVARNNSGIIINSRNSGTVTGDTDSSRITGGLVGYNDGTIANSRNSGAVTGGKYTGGLAGDNVDIITNSWNSGTITGSSGRSSHAGGLAGENFFATISNSWNSGTVTGGSSSSQTGGLVGYAVEGSIFNCWNSGARPTTGTYTGTLVGYCEKIPTIVCCYAADDAYVGTGIYTGVDTLAVKSADEMKTAAFAVLLNANCATEEYVSTYTYGKLTVDHLWYWHISTDGGLPYLSAEKPAESISNLEIRADENDATQAVVTFNATAAAPYTVKWYFNSTEIGSATVNQCTCTITGLERGKMYTVYVTSTVGTNVSANVSASAFKNYTVKLIGDGTSASPYLIRNDKELAALAATSHVNGTAGFGSGEYYRQTANLTLNDVGFAYFSGV